MLGDSLGLENNRKTIVITGASKGLGRHLVLHYGRKGMNVVAIARNWEKLSDLVREVKDNGGNASFFAIDITDHTALENTAGEIEEEYGSVDTLINNAGTSNDSPLEELGCDEIEKIIDTNLKGTIFTTKLIFPLMKDAPGTKYIFNISSMSGERGLKNNGIYHASKFGVNGFSNAMSKYLMPHRINVVTLCPGGINTSWWQKNEDWPYDKKDLMEPTEISRVIDFILEGRDSTLFQKVQFFPSCVVDKW